LQHQQSQVQQAQQQQAAQLKKQQQREAEQAICSRIHEEVSHLCHLDNYIGSHANIESLYKKIQRLQRAGKETILSLPG
jgi:polysaccharide deacetylase 2 family uncharacterized protein YibQ